MSNFQTVLIDPPWNETGGGKIKRGADKHYPVMRWPEIVATITGCPHWKDVAGSSHLYLWVTNNHLPDGLKVIEALGYRYVTNVVWAKDGRSGLGQYFRGRHELLLFATRGPRPTEPKTDLRNVPSLFNAPRGRHSEKPAQSYDLIESRSQAPRLELFARRVRPGWVAWGNEV